jgi:hypothetical protein
MYRSGPESVGQALWVDREVGGGKLREWTRKWRRAVLEAVQTVEGVASFRDRFRKWKQAFNTDKQIQKSNLASEQEHVLLSC